MTSIFKTPEGKREVLSRYDELLTLWPQPYQHFTVPTTFGNTFVIASGQEGGPAVVLLHGSATNSAMWMADAAVLGASYRVYAIDIIGEPGKSAESRPNMDTAVYAAWLAEVFISLGIRSAAVIGNSLGGWMALSLAAQMPERVSALVLLAPSGLAPIRSSFMFKAIWHTMHGEKGVARLNRLIFGDIEMDEAALALGRLLQQNYIPRPLQNMPVVTDDQLGRFTMPVLFFGGACDPLINVQKSAARLAALVPHAKVHVLKGAAHTLINLGQAIAVFLEKGETNT
jgi:pimeloyl-ACP methyl ester carboxylesterase